MKNDVTERLQRDLQSLDLYPGIIDGKWGDLTEVGYQSLLELAQRQQSPAAGAKYLDRSLAWGAKVSNVFQSRVNWISDQLGISPSWLMACMAFESAETFSPSIRNAAGSGATGLIQFMPATAKALGTSTEALAAMTAEDQLNYVYRYFLPYKGRIKNLGDLYMAILWPAGIGKSDDYVLWEKGRRPTTYRQNAGLDLDRDGAITRGEALTKIREKFGKGRQTEYLG